MSLTVNVPKGFKRYCMKCKSRSLTFWEINLTNNKKLKIKRCNKCKREVSIRS